MAFRIQRVVLILIVVATAIPAELAGPEFHLRRWDLVDVAANLLLYLPLGLSLGAAATTGRALAVSASLSSTIEAAQLFYTNRIAHPLDVGANVAGALAGLALARRSGIRPAVVRLNRPAGVLLLTLAGAWIVSSRTFAMYVRTFGWFASEAAQPRFWSVVPDAVVAAGVKVHALGALTNTAVAALLAAAGVLALVQPRHAWLRSAAAAAAGYCAGTIIMPNLNVFPLAYTAVGACTGLALSACGAQDASDAELV